MKSVGGRERAVGIVLAGAHTWDAAGQEGFVVRPLLPVAQTPLVCYPLRWLREGGICASTICGNGSSMLIRRRLGDGSPLAMSLEYLDDDMPRGTAGCVLDAVHGTGAKTCVVVDGTIVPGARLDEVLAQHHATKAMITVVVARRGGENGRCISTEPCGIYIFDRSATRFIRESGYEDIKESVVPRMYEAGAKVSTLVSREVSPRVTDIPSYLSVTAWMLSRMCGGDQPPRGYRVVHGSLIHESARMDPRSTMLGPVMVGPEACVSAETMLVGPVSIGKGCRIDRDATICRSILWDDCVIGAGSLVDRCVLGQGLVIGPQATEANRFLQRQQWAGGRHASRRRGGRLSRSGSNRFPRRADIVCNA